MDNVLEWLLQVDQPSIRYLALTELLDKPQNDSDVRLTATRIGEVGWAAEILRKQDPAGWWVSERSLYRPKYLSTNWMLLTLSDLGLTRKDPRINTACELWVRRFAKSDGGFGGEGAQKSHLCLTGNTARALVKFGYEDSPHVRSAFRWLVREQKENGGWHCWSLKGINGTLDAWEGMSAFAAYPKQKWTRSMKRAVERGAEFYLRRELHKQGPRYGPWYRFHFPEHYYYDLLVGLDFLTALGYGSDKRLRYAVDLLKQRRRSDGKWNLDAVYPSGAHTGPSTPFSLDRVGEPSKMITLKALRVLKRIDGSPPAFVYSS